MPGYLLSSRARRNIIEIWQYIAQDSVHHADQFIDQITRRFAMLGQNPYLGRAREDIRKGIRSFPVKEYEILYRVGDPGIRIAAVVHGRRNLAALFVSQPKP